MAQRQRWDSNRDEKMALTKDQRNLITKLGKTHSIPEIKRLLKYEYGLDVKYEVVKYWVNPEAGRATSNARKSRFYENSKKDPKKHEAYLKRMRAYNRKHPPTKAS